MIISSWNVNSVRARIENIKSYLLKYKPDIVMMQEIKTEDVNFPYDDFSAMDYESHVFGQKSYNGVAIISKDKLNNIRTDLIKDKLINNILRTHNDQVINNGDGFGGLYSGRNINKKLSMLIK